jgi:hypothetical protein
MSATLASIQLVKEALLFLQLLLEILKTFPEQLYTVEENSTIN